MQPLKTELSRHALAVSPRQGDGIQCSLKVWKQNQNVLRVSAYYDRLTSLIQKTSFKQGAAVLPGDAHNATGVYLTQTNRSLGTYLRYRMAASTGASQANGRSGPFLPTSRIISSTPVRMNTSAGFRQTGCRVPAMERVLPLSASSPSLFAYRADRDTKQCRHTRDRSRFSLAIL